MTDPVSPKFPLEGNFGLASDGAHARRRGGEALKRLQAGECPAPSTVIDLYGSWAVAVADAVGGG